MTTFIPFIPSNITAPTFNVTFDSNPYTVAVTWNVAAQRYYVNVYSSNGNWVFTVPLRNTARSRNVVSLTYDALGRRMVGKFDAPFWRPAGQVLLYTFENFIPDTLNGPQRCLRLTPAEGDFSFSVVSDPGQIVSLGSAGRYHDMNAGYFASTMIFRNGQFEVTP